MGTYISIPYVTRRSVHVEQSKPVTVQTTKVDSIPEEVKEEPKVEEPKVEEPKVEEPKVEEPKVEEPKVEEPKVEEPKVEEPKAEEPKVENPTVEVKEEPKEELKVEAKNEIVEAEVIIPELLPKQLSVTIPSESEVASGLSEQAPRIPEFRGNMNSESHAIKKFNRRHRKHLQN